MLNKKNSCFIAFFQKLFVLDNYIYPSRFKNMFVYVIPIRPPYLLWNISEISLDSPQGGFPRVTYHSLLAS